MFAIQALTSSRVAGSTNAPIADAMKSTEPRTFTAMIHQPRSPGRQTNRPWPSSSHSTAPEARNSTQPITSGVQISRSCAPAVRPWMSESTRLRPKTIVPRNSSAPATQSARWGSKLHQRHRPTAPPAIPTVRGALIASSSESYPPVLKNSPPQK